MSNTQQPEALRMADALEKYSHNSFLSPLIELAAELRRQHARIEELEDVADMAIKRIEELEAQLYAPAHPAKGVLAPMPVLHPPSLHCTHR